MVTNSEITAQTWACPNLDYFPISLRPWFENTWNWVIGRPYSWSNSTTYWRIEVSCPAFTGNASAVISGLMTFCFRVDTRDELLGCNSTSAEAATDTRTLLGCPWKMITCIMWIIRAGRFGWRYRRAVDHEVTKQGTSLRDHWRLG